MEIISFSDFAVLKLAQGLAQRRVFGGLCRMLSTSRLLRILIQEAEQVWILVLESLLRLLFWGLGLFECLFLWGYTFCSFPFSCLFIFFLSLLILSIRIISAFWLDSHDFFVFTGVFVEAKSGIRVSLLEHKRGRPDLSLVHHVIQLLLLQAFCKG